MKKRLLSLVLVLVVILGMVPGTVWAATSSLTDYFAGMPLTADGGTGTTAWVADGDQVKSGSKGKAYSTSTLTLTFTADTAVSFEYKVSSEKGYDKCTITLGSETIADAVSGEIDWTGVTGEVKAGEKLTVAYKKDSGGDEGDDCVYLRNFSCGTPLTVTFHNGSETYTQNIFGGSGTLKENTFAEAGKVFAGWASSAESTEVAYADGAAITLEANIDLYAVWADAYTVTFDNNGVTSTVDVAQNYAIGAGNIPTDPTLKGYVFGGWFHGETQLTAETVISAPVTYTAKWTPISYTIRFHANGGEGTVEEISAKYDQDITLPACGFTRAGYQFNGWSTYASASSGDAAGKTVKNLTSTEGAVVDYYAAWAGLPVQVTIDLNYEGGENYTRTGVVGKNYNYVYNESTGGASFSSLPTPTRTGYLFDGWFTAAEGGEEIGTEEKKFGFTAADAENGKTMYAHWAKAVTVIFVNGEETYKTNVIKESSGYGYVSSPSKSGQVFEGWFTEAGEKVESTTPLMEDTTLYAHWRPYQITITFDPNGGEGTMEKMVCNYKENYTLSPNQFTREGYRFVKWVDSISSWGTPNEYADGADYVWSPNYVYNDSTKTFYAVWEQTVFGKAYEAIGNVLPEDGIVQAEGPLGLPTSGEGYTVTYVSSDTTYISAEAEVVKLPETGTVQVTLTAAVTDTESGKTETKAYGITLYSAEATATAEELAQAAKAVQGNCRPVYGTDTNINTAMEQELKEKGYTGVKVSVKEANAPADGYASIDADGTIHYYFNPGMSGSGANFYVTFVLEKNGLSVEQERYTTLTWDEARVRQVLEAELERIALPTGALTELELPKYPYADGVDADSADGTNYNDFKTWATISWTSADRAIVEVGDAPSYPYYAPYATVLNNNTPIDQTVTLTAKIKCNSGSNVAAEKEFQVTVQHGTSTQTVQDALEEKLEAGLAAPGLTDYVTGEALDPENVINDIQFPTTRDFKIDGKYYPVTITSSNPDVIETPDVNNAARVWVYRPLPGEAPVDVTLTIAITEKSSGISASKEIQVTVQPLTQEEIDAEIALMEQVKANYFNGIRNANTDPGDITTDLHAFQEAYLSDGELVWVYDYRDRVNHGIVPAEIEGWETLEQWRTFRSSNAAVITHENLLVTRQTESKAVTITSYLSSETLGKYAERYPNEPDFQKLYYQPVSAALVVTGTNPSGDTPVEESLTVSFTLQDASSTLIGKTTVSGLPEGSTVFDVFADVMAEKGYSYAARGSYIYAITTPDGRTIEELDAGENSGWMYKVNGVIPSAYMAAYALNNNDNIVVFFTKDYTQENWSPSGKEEPEGTVEILFPDVKGHWGVSAIQYVYDKRLMNGVGETEFAPEATLSRGMLATVLYRMAGAPSVKGESGFSDVESKAWYEAAVIWAAENGIVKGFDDGRFYPELEVSREQAAAMLRRYADWKSLNTDARSELSDFQDAGEISTWAEEDLSWANAVGLVTGKDNNILDPGGDATRAEAATILMRFCENIAK